LADCPALVKAFRSGRPYWWQWYTILSLDAVAASLAWQQMLAQVGGAPLRPAHAAVLGLSVWLAYSADRWIEGWRLPLENALTQRHYFAVRWRWPLFALWITLLAADLTIAFTQLTARELHAGYALLAGVAAYLLVHPFVRRVKRFQPPKELIVAVLITAGMSLFVVVQPHASENALILPIALTALLCFCNCVLISLWEQEVDTTHGQISFANQFDRAHGAGHLFPWALGVISGLVSPLAQSYQRVALLCVAASAFLLGLVDFLEPRIGRQLARVLADVVLLTPWVAFALS
jgi:hypothetical protein